MTGIQGATWEGYEDSIGGIEKLLPMDRYEVEVVAANPMYRDGVTGRAIFLDLQVVSGPEKSTMATVYVFVPEPGNRRGGGWYIQKMRGFGDLKPVYAIMPAADLQGALNILCAALIGRRLWAQVGPGNGEFSNKNSIYESWVIEDQPALEPPTPEQVQAVEASYMRRDPTPSYGGSTPMWGTPAPGVPPQSTSVWGTPSIPEVVKVAAASMPPPIPTPQVAPQPTPPMPTPQIIEISQSDVGAMPDLVIPEPPIAPTMVAMPEPKPMQPQEPNGQPPQAVPTFMEEDEDESVLVPRF